MSVDNLFNELAQDVLRELKNAKKDTDLIFNAKYNLYTYKENDDFGATLFKKSANKAIQQRIDEQKALRVIYDQIANDLFIAMFSPNDYIREIAKIIKERKEANE